MRIDRKLNLVFPIDCDGGPFYVHAMPIDRDTFERYHMVISKVFTEFYTQRINVVGAPKVAALMLKATAQTMKVWEGPEGVEIGLLGEIRRLCNVVMPTAEGWVATPLSEAIARKLISDDDLAEVEAATVYFIVASAMFRRTILPVMMFQVDNLWGTKTTSLSLSEWIASLPTSTGTEPSVTVEGSSVPT